MAKSVGIPKTGNEVIDRAFDVIRAAFREISGSPLLDARLAVDENGHHTFALTTSFQDIPHGLDRECQGWIVIAPDANATIWEDSPTMLASAKLRSKFIRVKASAAVNCKFLVF